MISTEIAFYCFWLLLKTNAGFIINGNSSSFFKNNITRYAFQNDADIFQKLIRNNTLVLNNVWTWAWTWENKIIPYSFSPEYTYNEKSNVIEAMREIERKTCLRYKSRTTESSYINFEQHSLPYCNSHIGRSKEGSMQNIVLNNGCIHHHDSILHELLHSLGFLHEQSRHDRDDYITINWANVERIGFNRFDSDWKKYDASEILHLNTGYDYTSVMHYPTIIFGLTVITPKLPGVRIKSHGLSPTDVQRINILYKCSDKEQHHRNDSQKNNDQCLHGSYYCGSELQKKNYKNVISDNILYYCDKGKAKYVLNCGTDGCLEESKSRCACLPNTKYCGFELFTMNWSNKDFENSLNTLYICNSKGEVTKEGVCSGRCKEDEPSSYCSNEEQQKCGALLFYCGYQLSELGHRYIKSSALYQCSSNRLEGIEYKNCDNGCKRNTNGNSYCSTEDRVAYL